LGISWGRLFLLRIAGARQYFGTADQNARVDTERPPDEAKDDDGTDAKAAGATHRNASAAPAPIFYSVASWQLVQTHGYSPPGLPQLYGDEQRVRTLRPNIVAELSRLHRLILPITDLVTRLQR
jgi:hypothetical protein